MFRALGFQRRMEPVQVLVEWSKDFSRMLECHGVGSSPRGLAQTFSQDRKPAQGVRWFGSPFRLDSRPVAPELQIRRLECSTVITQPSRFDQGV